MKTAKYLWSVAVLAAGAMLALFFCTAMDRTTPTKPPTTLANKKAGKENKQQEAVNFARLPLRFEPNEGQNDAQVKFISRGAGYSLFLTPTEAVMALRKPKPKSFEPRTALVPTAERQSEGAGAVLHMKLLGASPRATVSGEGALPGKSNYFIGNDPKKWRTNVPQFAKVHYKDIYPGIDLVYYGNQQQLEYDFVVAPGADPAAITLAVEGAEKIELAGQGDLLLDTSGGEVRIHRPVVYQEIGGVRHEIPGSFLFKDNHKIGFQVAAYDSGKPLVIDPVLNYSTYLGGSSQESVGSIAIDSEGNAYVAGATQGYGFPTTAGAWDTTDDGPYYHDGFVAKLNPSGTSLVYATYLGGGNSDGVGGMAVDTAGSAYVTGDTESMDFPTTEGAFDRSFNGGWRDGFVAKLSPDGSQLLYSTYLGGGVQSTFDQPTSIAVDSAGNAYATGCTDAIDFPTTPGAFDRTYNGPSWGINCWGDAFVTKLDASGGALVYSTYLGGSGFEAANSIAVYADGNAYVTGSTNSPDFPTTPNAIQSAYKAGGGGGYFPGGPTDTFVVKLNATGSALVYSTYLGGSGEDYGFGIASDAAGNAYVAGYTSSADFPTTAGAYDRTYDVSDLFVVKLDASGTTLLYATFLGGSDWEYPGGLALDSAGNAYVVGMTASSDFPTTPDAFDRAFHGLSDGVLAKLDANGASLLYATYLGGSDWDGVTRVAVDAAGNAYLAGWTLSTDFPTTPGAFDTSYNGYYDVFVAKIPTVTNRSPAANAAPDQTVECTSAAGCSVTLDGTASSDPDGDVLSYEWRDAGNNVVGTAATVTLTMPLGTHSFTLTVSDGKGGTASDDVITTVQDNTAPNLTLTTNSLTVVLPTAGASGATVDLSGIASASDACDPSPVVSNNAPALFPIGTTVVIFTATDHSGNYSQKQLAVQVVYNFIGFLPPIRNDGSSIFKSGRTIPVKFQLTAADGSLVTNAVATLHVFKFTDVVLGTTEEVTPDAAGDSNTDNLFRFDATSNQYIYNLNTTGFAAGSYLLRVTLNDGTGHEVIVSVRT